MRRTNNIVIKKQGTRCVVSPPLIVVAPGDKVTVNNTTGKTVAIHIVELNRTYKIPPTPFGTSARHPLTVPNVRPGAYHYVVICSAQVEFCITSGLPIIIVPRRE